MKTKNQIAAAHGTLKDLFDRVPTVQDRDIFVACIAVLDWTLDTDNADIFEDYLATIRKAQIRGILTRIE